MYLKSVCVWGGGGGLTVLFQNVTDEIQTNIVFFIMTFVNLALK